MKKNRSSVFFGALLVAFGLFILAFNYDLINFTFREIAQFWPLLILIGGVAVILHPQKAFFNTVTALCLAFSIPLGIYSSATKGVENIKSELENDMDFDFNFDDEDYSYHEDELNEDNSSTDSKGVVTQNYSLPLDAGVERAKLDFGGGAAEFHLEPTSSNIFEAKTTLQNGSYSLSDQIKGNTHDIEFNMKSKKNNRFSVNDEFDLKNDVYLKLNTKPIWEMEIKVGAGDLHFDLSEYKVEKLKVETGAASIDIKLGDKQNKLSVDCSSGVAKLKFMIPESIGCVIDIDGAMNSKDFKGFNKRNGKYYTDNYDTASKTITIDMASALSSLEVGRY